MELDDLTLPLLLWYRENARDLPWRKKPTAYRVWVSEIMLQQTRVAAVLDYYRRFLEELPDVQALAEVPEERLMKLWQGLGYYSRARNLQRAARTIVSGFGGRFPERYEDIRALPGVGDYTAGAVGSIAFGLPTPAVDGNVLRVIARITGDGGDISTPAMKKRVTEALARAIPVDAPGDYNQALMELGATVCLPNGAPLCEKCPAARLCTAFQQGRTGELPVKAPKKPRREEDRTVYLLFYDGCVALRPVTTERAGTARHIFTHIQWNMTAIAAELDGPALPEGWVWADRGELEREYALPSAFQGFYGAVMERLGRF